MEQAEKMSAFAKATARQSTLTSTVRAKTGGKGIRTPDFQLAKLALYQLSYAPGSEFSNVDCRLSIARQEKQNAGCRSSKSTSGTRCFSSLPYCETGTVKYAVNTPVIGSIALPVICPALFMSLALARVAGKPPLTSFRSVGVLP